MLQKLAEWFYFLFYYNSLFLSTWGRAVSPNVQKANLLEDYWSEITVYGAAALRGMSSYCASIEEKLREMNNMLLPKVEEGTCPNVLPTHPSSSALTPLPAAWSPTRVAMATRAAGVMKTIAHRHRSSSSTHDDEIRRRIKSTRDLSPYNRQCGSRAKRRRSLLLSFCIYSRTLLPWPLLDDISTSTSQPCIY